MLQCFGSLSVIGNPSRPEHDKLLRWMLFRLVPFFSSCLNTTLEPLHPLASPYVLLSALILLPRSMNEILLRIDCRRPVDQQEEEEVAVEDACPYTRL